MLFLEADAFPKGLKMWLMMVPRSLPIWSSVESEQSSDIKSRVRSPPSPIPVVCLFLLRLFYMAIPNRFFKRHHQRIDRLFPYRDKIKLVAPLNVGPAMQYLNHLRDWLCSTSNVESHCEPHNPFFIGMLPLRKCWGRNAGTVCTGRTLALSFWSVLQPFPRYVGVAIPPSAVQCSACNRTPFLKAASRAGPQSTSLL